MAASFGEVVAEAAVVKACELVEVLCHCWCYCLDCLDDCIGCSSSFVDLAAFEIAVFVVGLAVLAELAEEKFVVVVAVVEPPLD